MVVLARAAGLPARLVIGYATGTYDEAHQRFVVTEADAHSWPEIYFPGYGWIRFEPTGGGLILTALHRPPVPSIFHRSMLPNQQGPFRGFFILRIALFTLTGWRCLPWPA